MAKPESIGKEPQPKYDRQQRKILGYFERGKDENVISTADYQISDVSAQRIKQQIETGKISSRDEHEFLCKIMPPLDNPKADHKQIYRNIMQDPMQQELYRRCTGSREPINILDMHAFTSGEAGGCTTPVELAPRRAAILNDLKKSLPKSKIKEYRKAFDALESNLYGKRWEYYQKFEELKKPAEPERHSRWEEMSQRAIAMLAKRFSATKESTLARVNEASKKRHPEAAAKNHYKSQAPETNKNRHEQIGSALPFIATIDGETSRKILTATKLEGDAYSETSTQLTAQNLGEFGLQPKHTILLENHKIDFSDTYKVDGRRSAVIAYVHTEKGIAARTYYRSNSQGVWRYLPDYTADPGGQPNWYGKGYSEAALTLPAEIQNTLDRLDEQPKDHTNIHGQQVELSGIQARLAFFGTACYAGRTDREYREKITSEQPGSALYKEVTANPEKIANQARARYQNSQPTRYDLPIPETVQPKLGSSPDFDKILFSYSSKTAIAGDATTEVYPSKDGQYRYLICTDSQGRSWIGGIETTSKITSTGCRERWVDPGALATPLYEYDSQTSGYGDATDVRRNYQCMWNHYLAKIPIFQEYRAKKQNPSIRQKIG